MPVTCRLPETKNEIKFQLSLRLQYRRCQLESFGRGRFRLQTPDELFNDSSPCRQETAVRWYGSVLECTSGWSFAISWRDSKLAQQKAQASLSGPRARPLEYGTLPPPSSGEACFASRDHRLRQGI